MKVNLAELKRSLSECHVKSEDSLSKILRESDEKYQVDRAIEELKMIKYSEPAKVIERLTLSIQLLNMARTSIKKSLDQTKD